MLKNPTVQASQMGLIVAILTDINACNNNISINNKQGGGVGSHLVWRDDFFFFGFSGYFLCFLFFLVTILLFVCFLIYL